MVMILHSREEFDHLVVLGYAEGVSIRALARRLGCSRNTIRAILRKHKARRDEGPDGLATKRKRLPKESKLDAYLPKIGHTLEAFPDITGQRLFEILKEQGYGGGISILRERLQRLRPRPKKEPILRFETEPGEQGQMDWSPYAIPFTRTGKGQVLCFSYILGYSRRHYIDFTARRDFFTLIRRHVDAFEHFAGVPKQCLYDSEKTVVLRWEAGKPVFNPAFVAFITHYECKPIACRRGRAQTKGKVERPFQYVESNLLNGRKFQDVEDLRATARWWLGERCDRHRHETTGRPPIELFEEDERPALTPLPLHPYDAAEVALRVCDGEGFLDFETNRYSVPYAYLFDILTLKATEHEVFVYSPELDLIARHERLPAGARQPVEIASHHGLDEDPLRTRTGAGSLSRARRGGADLSRRTEGPSKRRLSRPLDSEAQRTLPHRRHPPGAYPRQPLPRLRRQGRRAHPRRQSHTAHARIDPKPKSPRRARGLPSAHRAALARRIQRSTDSKKPAGE